MIRKKRHVEIEKFSLEGDDFKSSGRERKKQLSIGFTLKEIEMLKSLSTEECLSVNAFVRRCVIKSLEKEV